MTRTDQELYSTVRQHLLRQGRRSTTTTNGMTRCVYRGIEGTQCAIGCLIPDDLYSPELEGCSAHTDRIMRAASLSPEQKGLADDLQNCHDFVEPEHWEVRLNELAAGYALEAR